MRAPYGHRIFLGPGSQVLMLMHVSVSEEYTAAHSAEVLGQCPRPSFLTAAATAAAATLEAALQAGRAPVLSTPPLRSLRGSRRSALFCPA